MKKMLHPEDKTKHQNSRSSKDSSCGAPRRTCTCSMPMVRAAPVAAGKSPSPRFWIEHPRIPAKAALPPTGAAKAVAVNLPPSADFTKLPAMLKFCGHSQRGKYGGHAVQSRPLGNLHRG